MAPSKLSRARRRRSASIGKVVQVFELSEEESLSFTEIRTQSGINGKTLSSVLHELKENGYLIHETSYYSPRESYYTIVAELTDRQLDIIEEEYENEYQELLGYLDPVFALEHDAKRRGLERIRNALTLTKSGVSSRTITISKVDIQQLYFSWLRDCFRHLRYAISQTYEMQKPRTWEKCAYCQYGKYRYTERIGGKPVVRCKRERRSVDHPSDHYCDHFVLNRT